MWKYYICNKIPNYEGATSPFLQQTKNNTADTYLLQPNSQFLETFRGDLVSLPGVQGVSLPELTSQRLTGRDPPLTDWHAYQWRNSEFIMYYLTSSNFVWNKIQTLCLFIVVLDWCCVCLVAVYIQLCNITLTWAHHAKIGIMPYAASLFPKQTWL